jgi:hypothetical protein
VVKSAVISTSPAERTTSSAIVLSFPLLQLIHAFARAAIGPVSSSPRIVASDPPIWMPPERCRRALKATQIAVPEEALFVKESSAKPKSAFPGVIEA